MSLLSSFIGESLHTVNAAGRTSIPAKFREVLRTKYNDDSLVLVCISNHIIAYPLLEWSKKEQEWEANPPSNREEMNLYRRMYSSAEVVEVDRQGRIIIPALHRQKSDLGADTECTIVGLRNRIEIWNAKLWQETMKDDLSGDGDAIGGQFNELIL